MSGKPENTDLLDGREAELATSKLIELFTDEIRFDCHSILIAFSRSFARQELCRRGRSALPEIVSHLKENPPSDTGRLLSAWCLLLSNIELNIDSECPVPENLDDIQGWISWAEKMLEVDSAAGMVKCPGCDLKLPKDDLAAQMAHMDECHPEIISERCKGL